MKEKKEVIYFTILIWGVMIIAFAPMLLPNFLHTFWGEKAAWVGDRIGGTTAPLIGALSAWLVYQAFTEQIKANQLTQEHFLIQYFSDVWGQMVENYRINLKKGYIINIPQVSRKTVSPNIMIGELNNFWDGKISPKFYLYRNQSQNDFIKTISSELENLKKDNPMNIKYY